MDASFIGIDMAWRIDGGHSGIAIMSGNAQAVALDSVSTGIRSLAGIVEFAADHARSDTVVAIDASLVVINKTGQRPCETLIGALFGRYHASCHTSNLGRPYARTGMQLVGALEQLGFRHDFDIEQPKQRNGKWVFEVYPHPAMVRLFGLDRVIAYKKGSITERRVGLAVLRQHLSALADGSQGLVMSASLASLLSLDLEAIRGRELKHYEDKLDAVFCAYLAWHCWRWGEERNDMFGTLERGYIVVPKHGVLGQTTLLR